MKNLIVIELERSIKELFSYKLNIILANMSLLIMFVGLIKFSDSGSSPEVQLSIMLGWYIFIHGITHPTYIIEEEIMDQTIVNIIASRTSLYAIIFIRLIVVFVIDLIKVSVFFILTYILTGVGFSFDELVVLFGMILIVWLISCFIGILISSATLIYSKTSHLTGVLYYFILFFSGGMFVLKSTSVIAVNTLLPFYNYNMTLGLYYDEKLFDIYNLKFFAIQIIVYGLMSYILLNKSLKLKIKDGDILNG